MIFPPIPILETRRLQLRKLTMEDADSYYRHLGSSPEVTRYMLWEPHKDISESIASIQKSLRRYEKGRCYRWGIARKDCGSLIGVLELLRFDEETGNCSFAYMLGAEFWGNSYAAEALKAAFDFAFTEMGVTSVTADHFADNPASGRAMEKAGMRKIRTLPGKYEKYGNAHDAVEYAVTAEEWNKTRR